MTQTEYLADPCGVSSLPFWKAEGICIPEGLRVVHDSRFDGTLWKDWMDEPYFRLQHPLVTVEQAVLPGQFCYDHACIEEFAEHINRCYGNICVTPEILDGHCRLPVYCPELWIVIREKETGQIAASGIAALDRRIGEGSLEWVQVSQSHRRLGLGRAIVLELLGRLQKSAAFATVSGQVNNPARPEQLYRACGFTGQDVWHVLTQK